MKIGFLDHALVDRTRPGTAGVSDMIWDLARGLVTLGDEVHIVGPYRTNQFPVSEVKVHTYPISDFYFRNILTQLYVIHKGINFLRKIPGLQIIHVPEYVSAALLTYYLPDIPIVLTTPGSIFERITRYNPYDSLTTIVYRWAARKAAQRCARIIATSQDMAYWWEFAGAKRETIAVIPLSVNTDIFYPHPQARGQLGWPTDQIHILFVGRLAAENRVDYLLEIMALLVKKLPHVHLHIVGNGPLELSMKTTSIELGLEDKVTWHGIIKFNDLPFYYSAADLLIFTRPTGAPPRVVPQALACGLPVASIDNEGVRDYVIDNWSGCFFSIGSVENSTEIVARFLQVKQSTNQKNQSLIMFGQENFSINMITQKIHNQVYKPILNLYP